MSANRKPPKENLAAIQAGCDVLHKHSIDRHKRPNFDFKATNIIKPDGTHQVNKSEKALQTLTIGLD